MAKLSERLTRLEQRQPRRLCPAGISPEQWQPLQAELQAWVGAGHPEPQPPATPSALADFTYTVKAELHAWATEQKRANEQQFIQAPS